MPTSYGVNSDRFLNSDGTLNEGKIREASHVAIHGVPPSHPEYSSEIAYGILCHIIAGGKLDLSDTSLTAWDGLTCLDTEDPKQVLARDILHALSTKE
jgi:hypothetical protein